jgi:uncharacterized protein (TIGR02646 family)
VIRIHRGEMPAVLLQKGTARAAQMHRDYLADRGAYRHGDKSFDFVKHRYYAHETVKAALKKAQHHKCAFCESKGSHIAHGDVEHFRPKAGYRQLRRGALKRPGYYWLAYAWENLFFACQMCNQREKRSWFPLEKGSKRARSPMHSIANERPLFVDPAREDPESAPDVSRAHRDRGERKQAREAHAPRARPQPTGARRASRGVARYGPDAL